MNKILFAGVTITAVVAAAVKAAKSKKYVNTSDIFDDIFDDIKSKATPSEDENLNEVDGPDEDYSGPELDDDPLYDPDIDGMYDPEPTEEETEELRRLDEHPYEYYCSSLSSNNDDNDDDSSVLPEQFPNEKEVRNAFWALFEPNDTYCGAWAYDLKPELSKESISRNANILLEYGDEFEKDIMAINGLCLDQLTNDASEHVRKLAKNYDLLKPVKGYGEDLKAIKGFAEMPVMAKLYAAVKMRYGLPIYSDAKYILASWRRFPTVKETVKTASCRDLNDFAWIMIEQAESEPFDAAGKYSKQSIDKLIEEAKLK